MTGIETTADVLARDAALLLTAGVDSSQVQALVLQARRTGADLLDLALVEERIDQFSLYKTLADELQIPFRRSGFALAADSPVEVTLRSGIAKAEIAGSRNAFAFALAPSGRELNILLRRKNDLANSNGFVTTPAALREALFRARADSIMHEACHALEQQSPGETAHTLPYGWVAALFLSCLVALAAVSTVIAFPVWHILSIGLGFLFLLNVSVRLSACFSVGDDYLPSAPPLADHALPVYSILVPLYREAAVLPQLLKSLQAIDYPSARLDVQLLIEENDTPMHEALRAIALPAFIHVTILPPGQPQTKPRALNAGLLLARGALCTVYDAEDRPEPDQLRKAAALFAVLPQDYACLQASLAIDHARETWITRLFALEYAALFDVVIPGLAAQQLPFGLGGTSNHFRIAALRAAGGWDAWNVTEDADVGMRLFRKGFMIGALPSTTFEEAPVTFRMWFNQRTRWMKGWIQTSLVHARAASAASFWQMPFGWTAAIALTYGTVISALFGPLLMALAFYEVLNGLLTRIDGPLQLVIWTFALTLSLVGTITMIVLGMAGARRRKLGALVPWIAIFPVYYLLMTLAAWRAVKDILVQPFHWRKTEHGLARLRADTPALENNGQRKTLLVE